MTFADFIRAQVERLGAGQRPGAGTLIAAMVCDVSDRTIRLWMSGKSNPNLSTQDGARLRLTQARHIFRSG